MGLSGHAVRARLCMRATAWTAWWRPPPRCRQSRRILFFIRLITCSTWARTLRCSALFFLAHQQGASGAFTVRVDQACVDVGPLGGHGHVPPALEGDSFDGDRRSSRPSGSQCLTSAGLAAPSEVSRLLRPRRAGYRVKRSLLSLWAREGDACPDRLSAGHARGIAPLVAESVHDQ